MRRRPRPAQRRGPSCRDDREMLGPGAVDRGQRDGPVEAREAGIALPCQPEEVDVGELSMASYSVEVKKAAVAKLVGFGDNLVTVAPNCSNRNPQLSQMAL